MEKHIFLIGFMGTGKSTIGKALASKLNKSFYDTDLEIAKVAQMEIPIIFQTYGEEYFRKLETTILLNLMKEQPAIIATGGGIVLSKENQEILKQQCLILLDTPIQEIYNRVKKDRNRPLLTKGDLFTTVEELYNQRKSIYLSLTNHIVETQQRSVDDCITEIVSLLPNCIKRQENVNTKHKNE